MGKKRNKKDLDEAEEIEYLKKGLKQAELKRDFKEVASIHNQLGNLYRLRGEFETALYHHKEEGKTVLEHFKTDEMSLGIAYRNIGEVYIDKKEEEKAVKYIQKFLKIAKNKRDHVEEQRAHITLGRIFLGFADKYADESNDPDAAEKRSEELDNAERQFTRAHEILCQDGFRALVKEKELAAMKCGTYLNLGITLDSKDKSKEALKWIEDAILLAKHYGLLDYLHRCYSALYASKVKAEKYDEALAAAKDMIRSAKAGGNKADEFEGRISEAKAAFHLDDVSMGVNILKRIRKQIIRMKSNEPFIALLDEIDPLLTAGVRILRAEDEYFASDRKDPFKLKCYYEVKGDNFVTLGNFKEAIKNYKESIRNAKNAGLQGKPLSALYYSLGATYKDSGDYDSALKYFEKELEIVSGNKSEEFRTQTNIAECMEKARKSQDSIIQAYRSAIKLAQDFPKKKITAYKNLAQYYKYIRKSDLAEKCTEEAERIAESLNMSASDVEDDSQELMLDEDSPIDLEELSSAPSESEEEEEQDVGKNVGKARKPFSFRRNEKGESPLHVAAQKGNVKEVRRLLAKGHEVNPRDYSGWIPLHEACNFGHYEVVVELLRHKAWVNDPGGKQCDGTTPLHDAANNGHISCMRALLEHGANSLLKDKSGNRVIDCLVFWFEASGSALTAEQVDDYNDMKAYLVDVLKRAGKTYTRKDEQAALRRNKRREKSPEFGIMRSKGGDEIPVKIIVPHPDEDEGRAGVEEYNETMSILRRKSLKTTRGRPISRENSPPKEALLAESQYVGSDWLVPDDSLARESSSSNNSSSNNNSNNKRKRDPFEDLKLTDRSIRRRSEGKRNVIARMDMMRLPEPDLSFQMESSPEVEDSFVDRPPSVSTQEEEERIIDYGNPEVLLDSENEADVTIVSDESDEDDFSRGFGSRSRRRGGDLKIPTKAKSCSLSRKRQTKLPFTRISQQGSQKDSDDADSPELEDLSGSSGPPLPVIAKPMLSQDVPRRVLVDVMGHKILVPLPHPDLTIDWLCRDVADRHFKQTGGCMRLTVSLKTMDGAKLSGTDTIRMVIAAEDTDLMAIIEDSEVIQLHKRFKLSLTKCGIEVDEDTIAAVTRCETSESLILADLPLRGKVHEVLFECLRHHYYLREMSFFGCALFDEGVKRLCKILPTLPNLLKLDLGCNGMTSAGLSEFVGVLRAPTKSDANYKPPVGLRNLNLSHNALGNSVTEHLVQLAKTLPHLKLLSVVDCNLTASFLSKCRQDLVNALQGSGIEIFDVSYNLLGIGALQTLKSEVCTARLTVVTDGCQ